MRHRSVLIFKQDAPRRKTTRRGSSRPIRDPAHTICNVCCIVHRNEAQNRIQRQLLQRWATERSRKWMSISFILRRCELAKKPSPTGAGTGQGSASAVLRLQDFSLCLCGIPLLVLLSHMIMCCSLPELPENALAMPSSKPSGLLISLQQSPRFRSIASSAAFAFPSPLSAAAFPALCTFCTLSALPQAFSWHVRAAAWRLT